MNLNRLVVLSLFAGLILSGLAHGADTLRRVQARGTLKVATNAGWEPQGYIDDSGQLVGFDIDVAREIARRLGVKPRFDTPDW